MLLPGLFLLCNLPVEGRTMFIPIKQCRPI
nr:MAG TPA: hypothetical protein [Crassvirales sp.]